MTSRFPGLLGLMIIGAPPVGHNAFSQGFRPMAAVRMAGKENPSQPEVEDFVQTIFADSAEPFLYEAVSRADGRFRKRLFEAARDNAGVDERITVENNSVPLAVVNGAADPIINLDYFDTVAYCNLWEGRCHRMPGLGHAPFWQAPDAFNVLLNRFLEEVCS
jgi:pimeloyl-ACP methyl ester carboxylesterase